MSDLLVGTRPGPLPGAPPKSLSPEVAAIAQRAMATLYLAVEAGVAGRVRPEEFPLPEDPAAFENMVAAAFDRLAPEAQEATARSVLASLDEPLERRRDALGDVAEVDVRAPEPIEAQARALPPLEIDPRRLHAAGRTPGAGKVAVTPAGGVEPGGDDFVGTGAIETKYKQLDGENGPLGPPTGPERLEKDGKGRTVRTRRFKQGLIVLADGLEAVAVHGPTYRRYRDEGELDSRFGLPVKDTTRSVGGGRVTDFENGFTLLWHPLRGVHEVHGAIRARYRQQGAEKGPAGYPVSDEQPIRDIPGGRMNRFARGEIRWHPEHGAHFLPTAVARKRQTVPMLAYAVTEPVPDGNGARYRFEGGSIRTSDRDGRVPAGAPTLPLPGIELALRHVRILKMPKFESLKAELFFGGSKIDPRGNVEQVPTHNLGAFKKSKKSRDFDKVLASWDLERDVAAWPASVALVAGAVENEMLAGSSIDFFSEVTDRLRAKVDELVAEGLEKLADKIANEWLGPIVGEVLGQIAGWVLDKLWDLLLKAWKDDPLRPRPVTLTLPNAFVFGSPKPGDRLGDPVVFETTGIDGIKIRATLEWRAA